MEERDVVKLGGGDANVMNKRAWICYMVMHC